MNATSPLRTLSRILFLVLFLGVAGEAQALSEKDAQCMRCHGMSTLAYQNPATGGLRNLSIDAKALAHSDHKDLSCRECHGPGFEAYPHFKEASQERLECLGCHEKSHSFPKELFESIERSFNRSVHFQTMQDDFTCFSCHDPHNFRALSGQSGEHLADVVARDNGVCLRCHDSPEGIRGKTGRLFSTLSQTHAWLPEANRHWGSVRCVECHTSGERERSHFILGKDYAVRKCESCHSRDSMLIAKLYRHRNREERRTAGFIHSVVMNDSYIIGMTRNQWLDWGGIGLVVLTLAGVGGHGLARYLVSRSNRHENHH
ncbi:MAG: cytochrome c3 family protein [Magnetococcales bacterium]|nr:cytochrome c3 family protein [Magnetococcales bacterium]